MFFAISFVLTNVYAVPSDVEIYCPATHIAVDGKCQPVNFTNPYHVK
ncbi:hypothetical protein NADRNF5_0639 [Nitrosopumilus adriaticus]|uniref:Uncharacterized protein n=1 Tax=Nitrosopumilus adriaticus TaxID=1580092 RepID=A0A0D5C1Y9_9ARCH|nr:hypothetical protein NADRNF5_0639 [Nitrosopumilus adriaticus]